MNHGSFSFSLLGTIDVFFFLGLLVKKEVAEGAAEGAPEVLPAPRAPPVADGEAKRRYAFLKK